MKERLIYNNKKGFTLVELIIVLALIAIVLAGIYTFYFFIQSSYNKNDARSYTNHQINMVFTQLDRDIRSASKPNKDTHAVRIVSSKELDIYIYDAKEENYIRVSYQFIPNSSILQRGWIACETGIPPSTANPPYGTIDNWETIMVGAVENTTIKDGGNEKEVTFGFEDITGSSANDRREIKITLIGNDMNKPLNKPIVAVKILTSRSRGFPK